MAAILYYKLDANFTDCTSTEAKIAKIDEIINQLLTTALTAVNTTGYVSYKIDTGQTIQEVTYRSPTVIADTVREYRRIRQLFVNDIVGNSWRNIDGKNLNRRFR